MSNIGRPGAERQFDFIREGCEIRAMIFAVRFFSVVLLGGISCQPSDSQKAAPLQNTGETIPRSATAAATTTPATPSDRQATNVAASAPAGRSYAVLDVAHNDVLNVRAEPDPKSAKVYSFGPSVAKIQSTGRSTIVNKTPWIEVLFEGGSGWVNRRFLREVVKGGGCNDERLLAAIRQLMRSVANADGVLLQELVSDMRGLSVRNSRWDSGVQIPAPEVGALYTSGQPRVWGVGEDPENPSRVEGTFRKVIYPDLEKAVTRKESREKCGEVLLGGTAGSNDLPLALAGLTPVSFHFPGNEQGGEDGPWHTTVAAFEYVEGEPRLAALVGYRWEM